MALFMFLSGYVFSIKKRNKGKRQQIRKLIINCGIPYVLFSVLWVLMKILLVAHTNNTVAWEDIVLIPIYPISFMWVIYALLIMQISQLIVGNHKKQFKAIHLLIAGGGTLYVHI